MSNDSILRSGSKGSMFSKESMTRVRSDRYPLSAGSPVTRMQAPMSAS